MSEQSTIRLSIGMYFKFKSLLHRQSMIAHQGVSTVHLLIHMLVIQTCMYRIYTCIYIYCLLEIIVMKCIDMY